MKKEIKSVLLVIAILFGGCTPNQGKKSFVGVKFNSFKQFTKSEGFLTKSTEIKALHLDFSSDTNIINQDTLFNIINKLNINYLDIAFFGINVPQRYKNYSIKDLSILTDTIESLNLTYFHALRTLQLSIFIKKFPDTLVLSDHVDKITLSGNFKEIPSFVFRQTKLRMLILKSKKFDVVTSHLLDLKNLEYFDISATKLAIDIRSGNKNAITMLKKISSNKTIIINPIDMPK